MLPRQPTSKGDAEKCKGKCQTCEFSNARGAEAPSLIATVRQKPEQETAFEKVLPEINKKLAEVPAIMCKLGELMLMKQTVDKLEQSVQHMSDQYDEVLKEMKRQSAEISTLKKKMENKSRLTMLAKRFRR